MFYLPIMIGIEWVLAIGGALAGVGAFFDAAIRRAELFPAADKQSKGMWAAITGGSGAVLTLGLLAPSGFLGPLTILWLAALVGCLVYILDVRPAIREIQRGSRW